MGYIDGIDDLVLRTTGGGANSAYECLPFYCDGRIGAAGGVVGIGKTYSLWTYNNIPGGGVAPTTVANPTNTTAGGIQQTNPGGGAQKWLIGIQVVAHTTLIGTLIVYDRLLHIGNLSGTVTTAQTVGGSLTRYTNGLGNRVWAEVYTAIGTTARTITMSYTNQAGASGQTGLASEIGGANFDEIQRCMFIMPAASDYGVQNVASVTLSASTLTAGNFGVTVGHYLTSCSFVQGSLMGERNMVLGFPSAIEITSNACLGFLWEGELATAPILSGNLITVCA